MGRAPCLVVVVSVERRCSPPVRGRALGWITLLGNYWTEVWRVIPSPDDIPIESYSRAGNTIGQRMERDLEVLLPLPPVAYDACEKQAGRVSSLSLVRYRTNDYSAPVAYGHRDVLVRGYVDQVVISCGSEVIAKHHRSYERDDFVYDPIHYLPLLECPMVMTTGPCGPWRARWWSWDWWSLCLPRRSACG